MKWKHSSALKSPAYGVFISQLIRYSKAYDSGFPWQDADANNEPTEGRCPIV